VASIPIPSGSSLRPVKNRGKVFFENVNQKLGKRYDKVADQNSPFIFTGQTTLLTKLSPILLPLIFLSHP